MSHVRAAWCNHSRGWLSKSPAAVYIHNKPIHITLPAACGAVHIWDIVTNINICSRTNSYHAGKSTVLQLWPLVFVYQYAPEYVAVLHLHLPYINWGYVVVIAPGPITIDPREQNIRWPLCTCLLCVQYRGVAQDIAQCWLRYVIAHHRGIPQGNPYKVYSACVADQCHDYLMPYIIITALFKITYKNMS